MYSIQGDTINLTRGDSLNIEVTIYDPEGNVYTPQEGDFIRFAVCKEKYGQVLISKDISKDDMLLHLDPEDTKELKFGKYIYDIQITLSDGTVDTFIADATLNLMTEVD